MSKFWANGFYGSLVIIGIIAICGMIQAMFQFCIYIYPKIKNTCRSLRDILINIHNFIKNIFIKIYNYTTSSCNNKMINKNIFFKNPVIPFNSHV